MCCFFNLIRQSIHTGIFQTIIIPDIKDLVIEGDEEGREVLGLGQVVVEGLAEAVQHTVPGEIFNT